MALVKSITENKSVNRLKRWLVLRSGIYLRLKRINPTVSEGLRIALLLKHYRITKVLDVGANTGQFAESLIDFGFKGEILSFEPVEKAYQMLQKRARKYKNWHVAERMAIGDEDGEIEINVSDSTDFSSIKPIKKAALSNKPEAKIVAKEKVPIRKLESLTDLSSGESEKLFLKIDTQGYEKEVLDGAEKILSSFRGVMLELPLRKELEIYENVRMDFADYYSYFQAKAFSLVSVEPVSVNKKTGFVRQVNCIFIKNQED